MGLSPFSRSSISSSGTLIYEPSSAHVSSRNPNPNPSNWIILSSEQINGHLIVELQYPNCTNFEGKKILVFEKCTLVQLVNQKLIDPHFFPANPKVRSPIARFEPTKRGWKMARAFLHNWRQ